MDKLQKLQQIITGLEKAAHRLDSIGMTQYSKVIDELTFQLDIELQYAEEAIDNVA